MGKGNTDKKRFKETKVGAFLTEKAPQVVSQIGEFLPDQGALDRDWETLFYNSL